MKNNNHSIKVLTLCVLLIISSVLLCSCFKEKGNPAMQTKEAISSAMASDLEGTDVHNYGYVSDYLQEWGFGGYDITKFKYMERIAIAYYNYEGGLPERREHARLCAEAFLTYFYDEIELTDSTELTDYLLVCYAGVVDDPYSVYRPAQQSADYNTDMSGKFGGIGVVVEYDHDAQTVMVTSVYLDSPAEAAGIQVGDYIIGVESVGIEEIGYTNIVNLIRGEIGTSVSITVKRGDDTLVCTPTRAEVVERTVDYSIRGDIGYILITDFKGNTYEQFVEAVKAIEAANVKGVIFDLRGNLGGYTDTACNMISYLVPTGHELLSYTYKGYDRTVLYTEDDVDPVTGEVSDHVLDLPMVVLCNGYTASSGEIFTSAIRDYRNDGTISAATIVGTLTYKKGIMQRGFLYPDGSSLTMTVAYYAPPCGVNYHGIGITPDVYVENTATEDLQYDAAVLELEKLINANLDLQK